MKYKDNIEVVNKLVDALEGINPPIKCHGKTLSITDVVDSTDRFRKEIIHLKLKDMLMKLSDELTEEVIMNQNYHFETLVQRNMNPYGIQRFTRVKASLVIYD